MKNWGMIIAVYPFDWAFHIWRCPWGTEYRGVWVGPFAIAFGSVQ